MAKNDLIFTSMNPTIARVVGRDSKFIMAMVFV